MRRLLTYAGVVAIALSLGSAQLGAENKETVSMAEAEILIYLMPVSKELRKQGFDAGWEIRETADSFNFLVYNSRRKCPEGCSVTVGDFSVNKHTGEVTDDSERVSNEDIRGVQRILRRAHHINSSEIGTK